MEQEGDSYEGGISTNLAVFIDKYINENLSVEEAAALTPTGIIAIKKIGYIKVLEKDIFARDFDDNLGKYVDIEEVQIEYIKP